MSAEEARFPAWRVSLRGRVAAFMLCLCWVGLTVGVGFGASGGAVVVILAIATVVVALAVWRAAFVPRISTSEEGIRVQNALLHTSIPWQEVNGTSAGYHGVVIRTKTMGVVRASAVQRSNAKKWANTKTRADEVAATLIALAGDGEQSSSTI
jgi:hypothetical protein